MCDKHGALIPAVQSAAATRIQMSVDDAASQLVAWMNDSAVDIRERVKIAHDLLDRGGLGATSKVLVGVVQEDPVERMFRDLLAHDDAFEPVRIELGHQPAALPPVEASVLDDVVDAELVDEPQPIGHTVHAQESMSATPPKHLREDLKRAQELRDLL